MDQNQDRRRGHFRRGRRLPDRRGGDRRPQQPQPQGGREQVDVEQVMRDIRSRIAHGEGSELSNQQVERLAARRLDAILDPRTIRPEVLEALRRSAEDTTERKEQRITNEPAYVFEESTLYDSHRAVLRFIRKLLNPLLKLFFNPNPLIGALHVQAKLNVAGAQREADRIRQQAEWNALHYKIVHRLLSEISRLSLEVHSLSLKVESLAARVDFNDRRVRSIEGATQTYRGGRPSESAAPAPVPETGSAPETADTPASEGNRRRRRRRRGRRPGGPGEAHVTAPVVPPPGSVGQSPEPSASVETELVDSSFDEDGMDEAEFETPPSPAFAVEIHATPRAELREPAPAEPAPAEETERIRSTTDIEPASDTDRSEK